MSSAPPRHTEHDPAENPGPPAVTLGERLARQARRLAARKLPEFAWLRSLEQVLSRVSGLPVPDQERFRRTEVPPHAPLVRSSFPREGRPAWEVPATEGVPLAPGAWPRPGETVRAGADAGRVDRVERAELPPEAPRSHSSVRPKDVAAWEAPATGGVPQAPAIRPRPGEVIGVVADAGAIDRVDRTEVPPQAPRWHSSLSPEETAAWEAPATEGLPLAPQVRLRLSEVVGTGTEAVRVHRDSVADAVARGQRADAVTLGRHVFFRAGRFRPDEDAGFALLAHEASHVLQALRPGTAWRRATGAGVAEEERAANAHEQAALAQQRTTAPHLREPGTSVERPAPTLGQGPRAGRSDDFGWRPPAVVPEPRAAAGPGAASSAALRPMAAPADRSVEAKAAEAPVVPDFEEMRRALYRDLIRQVRIDFERGG